MPEFAQTFGCFNFSISNVLQLVEAASSEASKAFHLVLNVAVTSANEEVVFIQCSPTLILQFSKGLLPRNFDKY